MESELIIFHSSLLKVIPGEDEEINPGRYGKQLSEWLLEKLETIGYKDLYIVNEDWGRCLMVEYQKHLLFVACSCINGDDNEADIQWAVYCSLEYPIFFFSNWFMSKKEKDINKEKFIRLSEHLKEIIYTEPTNRIILE